MTEDQFNDLMSMLADMRSDTVNVRNDLADLNSSVSALDPALVSSSYVLTTTVGPMDVRIDRSVSVGDVALLSTLFLFLIYLLIKSLYNTWRGLSL